MGLGDDDFFAAIARRYKYRLGIDLGTFVHHFHRSTFKKNYTKAEIASMQSKALKLYKEKISL